MKLTGDCPRRSADPTAAEKEGGKLIRYWSCPIKLVPEQIRHWFRMYEYETEFEGCRVPELRHRPRRYLLAWTYYKSKLTEYDREVQRRRERG